LLLLGTELAIARRWVWLLPLATAYTWLYDAFPFLLFLAASMVMSIALLERRVEWRGVVYPGLGVVVGLVVNPYFPNDIWFIAQHYLGKVQVGEGMHLGSEWYPYPLAQWLGWGGALAILVPLAMLAWRIRRELDVTRTALLLIGALFFVLAWRARRFIEYAGPFVLLALAATLHQRVEARALALTRRVRRGAMAALLIACGISAGLAIHQLRRRPTEDVYAGGAAWLVRHTPAGAIVFTPDWDDFPLLFFHDRHNRYVIGLDPTYLARQDPALYQLWQQLGRGELVPPSRFLGRFDSRVVLSDHTHDRFIAALAADPAMERAYEDSQCIIFRTIS
jgi:hypothetical protein